MGVIGEKMVCFVCEGCGKENFHDYTLEVSWYNDTQVAYFDRIDCHFCNHTNQVVEITRKK